MLRSFINSPTLSTKSLSLIFQLKNYNSNPKSHSKKVKFYEANPQLFRKYSRIKLPDFSKKDLIFPISIPIRFRYRFKPMKKAHIPPNDYINFKLMTGNEILLYLERYAELRSTELTGALIELGKKPGADKIDWNTHEFLIGCKDYMIPRLSQYTHRIIHNLIIAFHRLKIYDPILWSGLHKECNKLLHLANPSLLSRIYTILHDENIKAPQEMLDRMTIMMPNHLKMMSPNDIVSIFEIIVKSKYLNFHLFEDIFYIMFRKRNKWFGITNYAKIIRMFIEIKHFDDDPFWNTQFLPPLLQLSAQMNEDNIVPLKDALIELKKLSNDKVKIDDYLKLLDERLIFCKTKEKAIRNNQFFNMIINDLQYYKEKELEKMQRKPAV